MQERDEEMLDTPARGPLPRLTSSSRRRVVAASMAAVGIAALAVAIGWDPGQAQRPTVADPAGGKVALERPQTPGQATTTVGEGVVIPDTDGPGGVGDSPEKTGLPAKPGGGTVRTGSTEDGCFTDIRSYLDRWHQSGVEPDPCFTAQPASGQSQPSGVARSYNGQNF